MRDNYLSKSNRLLAAAEKVKDSLFKDGIVWLHPRLRRDPDGRR